MASIRFCLLSIVALVLGSTSGRQEPEPRVLIQEPSERKVDLNACIYLISVELVAPQEPLPEGVRFHLPNYVRAKLGDLLLLIAREAKTDEITSVDATIGGAAIERVGAMYSGTVTPSGSVIPVPTQGPPHLLLRTARTGKATVQAVVTYKGGRKETREIEVDVTETRDLRQE
jgi:hypothetical protein